jgi:hypothetical protein
MRSIKYLYVGLILLLIAGAANAQKLTAEEVLAKHLDSIGTKENRAAAATLISTGEVRITYVTQKNQPAAGRVVVASEGQKLFFGLGLNAADYPQEKIIYDGSRFNVDFVRPGVRSDLGSFVQSNAELVTHGLLGGTLSTGWALLHLADGKAKISYNGTKKIDGRETYSLNYSPKGGNDLEITMFFDKNTFQHVRTEYKRTLSSGIGRTIDESARQSESRLKVTEDFSDHKDINGITLPQKYKMSYVFTGSNGTKEVTWTYELLDFALNQKLDAGTFVVAK